MRYYYAHKDEPEFLERIRAMRRKWYYENIESERSKALERYYKNKAIKQEEKKAEEEDEKQTQSRLAILKK